MKRPTSQLSTGARLNAGAYTNLTKSGRYPPKHKAAQAEYYRLAARVAENQKQVSELIIPSEASPGRFAAIELFNCDFSRCLDSLPPVGTVLLG
jgi:hypothetical protein